MIRRLDDQLRRTRHLVSDRAVVDVRNPAPPTRLRLLIVDDNAVIRDVLGSLFRSECGDEVEIRTASGGAEALSTTTWQPDVIVLDWVMPGMDGLETARRLRGRGVTARIVVYSSAPPAEAEDAALAAGADRYLEKGADAEGLVRAVTEALQAQR
jgi:CheY-like chemotaxis protein